MGTGSVHSMHALCMATETLQESGPRVRSLTGVSPAEAQVFTHFLIFIFFIIDLHIFFCCIAWWPSYTYMYTFFFSHIMCY